MLLTGSTVIERYDGFFPVHYRLVDRGAAGWQGSVTIVATTVDALMPFGAEERLTFPLDAGRHFCFVVRQILIPYTLHVTGMVERSTGGAVT
jgi:hypothetical protein